MVREEFGTFDAYIWRFVDGKPVRNRFRALSELPVTSPQAESLSRDLRQPGFKFVGPTIIYAHMQATGMVNDQLDRVNGICENRVIAVARHAVLLVGQPDRCTPDELAGRTSPADTKYATNPSSGQLHITPGAPGFPGTLPLPLASWEELGRPRDKQASLSYNAAAKAGAAPILRPPARHNIPYHARRKGPWPLWGRS